MTDVMTRTCITEGCDNRVPDDQGSDYCSVCIIADRPDPQMPRAMFEALMEGGAITVTSVFVPFSMSRNAKPDPKLEDLSLNWRVTLKRDNWEILTTDYGAGIGHCESVGMEGERLGGMMRIRYAVDEEAIRGECEDGKARNVTKAGKARIRTRRGKGEDFGKAETWLTMPDPADVLQALLLDGEAIDSGGFEDWASDFGYDTDSIKAKAMYDACVETGLKLRNALGETLLKELREAAQDL